MTAIWICPLKERRRELMGNWTVWVGGSEVNDHYLTYDKAKSIARFWKDEGYDDVKIQEVLEW